MKSNELRIGNLVNVNSDMLSVTGADIAYFDFNGNDYSPIPLTPEILEKAGFYLQPQRISMWQRGRVKIWMGNNALAYLKHEDKDESYYIGECKSLHKLQNLYFALTGEELPIEL